MHNGLIDHREFSLEFCFVFYRFINGQSYMEAVAKAILAAKEEIFITDWWLSPELVLVRPASDDSMRLDTLLGKRAVRKCFLCEIELKEREFRKKEFVFM